VNRCLLPVVTGSSSGLGFFVTPTAERVNHHRIFVVREAVRQVAFP
jgi:hypothetical protein